MSEDNRTRKLIINYVSDNPGVTFSQLKKVFDLNRGTLRYHMDYLRKNEEIVSKTHDGKKCYYCISVRGNKSDRSERVLQIILNEPGITRKSLMTRSKCDRKALSACIQTLKRKHLVVIKRENGSIMYWPLDDDELRRQAYKLLVRKLLDGEIDEEEFLEMEGELKEERAG